MKFSDMGPFKTTIVESLNTLYKESPNIKYLNTLRPEIIKFYKDTKDMTLKFWPEELDSKAVEYLFDNEIFNEAQTPHESIAKLTQIIYTYVIASKVYQALDIYSEKSLLESFTFTCVLDEVNSCIASIDFRSTGFSCSDVANSFYIYGTITGEAKLTLGSSTKSAYVSTYVVRIGAFIQIDFLHEIAMGKTLDCPVDVVCSITVEVLSSDKPSDSRPGIRTTIMAPKLSLTAETFSASKFKAWLHDSIAYKALYSLLPSLAY